MSLFSELFKHRGNEALMREQALFFIRNIQNNTMEMGKLIQQVADAGHPDVSQQCSRLLQLNTQMGSTLEQIQKSLQ